MTATTLAAMSAGDVLAVVAATIVVILVAVLSTVLVALARTLRELRETVDALREEAIPLLDETAAAVHDAAVEIDKVERLVTAAERIGDTKRAIATPMVKAIAFSTGVSRAAQRLRDGEPSTPRRRRSAS